MFISYLPHTCSYITCPIYIHILPVPWSAPPAPAPPGEGGGRPRPTARTKSWWACHWPAEQACRLPPACRLSKRFFFLFHNTKKSKWNIKIVEFIRIYFSNLQRCFFFNLIFLVRKINEIKPLYLCKEVCIISHFWWKNVLNKAYLPRQKGVFII